MGEGVRSAKSCTHWSATLGVHALTAFFAFAPVVDAQQVDEPFKRLVNARSLRCELTRGVQASWDSGQLKLEPSAMSDAGKMTFDSISPKDGTARIIGNAGVGDVIVNVSIAGITFLEETKSGNLNITTIFASYESPGSRRFVAVQSRHQTLNGPFPSQYHGTCTVLE